MLKQLLSFLDKKTKTIVEEETKKLYNFFPLYKCQSCGYVNEWIYNNNDARYGKIETIRDSFRNGTMDFPKHKTILAKCGCTHSIHESEKNYLTLHEFVGFRYFERKEQDNKS